MQEVGRGEDEVRWAANTAGSFSVSSFYQTLASSGDRAFPWKAVWKVGAPIKVAFFSWTAAHGSILTMDNLIRRKKILVNWCCMCKRSSESVSHLLLHCSFAHELWCLVWSLFGISWVQQRAVELELAAWWGGRVGKKRKAAWLLAPLAVLWMVWLERNRRTFNGVEQLSHVLCSQLLSTMHAWLFGKFPPSLDAFLDFIDLCQM